MKQLSWWIAWRYVTHTWTTARISLILGVCILSIALASGSLVFVTAVMHGFEKALQDQIKTVHADAQIRSLDAPLNYHAIKDVIHREFPEIIGLSAQYSKEVLIQSPHTHVSRIIILKGIVPHDEYQVTKILSTITEQSRDSLNNHQLLLGASLLKQLRSKPGESIELVYLDDIIKNTKRIHLDSITADIGGFFKTGIDDIDMSVAYVHERFFVRHFPEEGVHQILLRIDPHADVPAVINRLKKRTHLPVYAWQKLYPALMHALVLERWVMICIVLLIALVASMNLIALLIMYITRKRGDIAILQALGMPIAQIKSIFIMMGCFIASIATIIGISCALLAIGFIAWYQPISLPAVYYVSTLPISIDIHTLIIIATSSIVLSVVASWWAARQTYAIPIAYLLKFEA